MNFTLSAEYTAHLAACARAEWQASFQAHAVACESPVSNYPESPSQCAPFPSPIIPAPARRGSQAKKKGPGHISRPPNAFLLFRSDFWAQEKKKPNPIERDHRDISRIAAYCWRNLDPVAQAHYHARAQALREEHKARYPGYRLIPSARRSRAPKQKSATVLQKELRCRALAQELMSTISLAEHILPVSQNYIPEYAHAHLDVIQPNMDAPQSVPYTQMTTVIFPKPIHPAFYSHGFTIEQNADLPVPLAPLAQAPGVMAECIDALSTLPPLPSYDATDFTPFSSTEAFQSTMPIFSNFDATSPAGSAFDISSLHNLSLPILSEESMYYPQDAGSLQIDFSQGPYPQYISQ